MVTLTQLVQKSHLLRLINYRTEFGVISYKKADPYCADNGHPV
jgi:hypothetical protein